MLPVTEATEAPTVTASAMSDTGGVLFGAAALCLMGGWLPALCGYGWHLPALALLCICAGVWADLRHTARIADCMEAPPGPRRPLRRLAEAERETLTRQRHPAP